MEAFIILWNMFKIYGSYIWSDYRNIFIVNLCVYYNE